MTDKNVLLTDSEFAALLHDKPTYEVANHLFEHFELNCINMEAQNRIKLDKLFDKLDSLAKENKEAAVLEIIEFIRSLNTENTDNSKYADEIKKYIEDNLDNEISDKDISEHFHISLYYMIHLFKKVTGKTIVEYRNNLKLENAKKLLTETDFNIAEIAQRCNYSTAPYFSKIFKREMKTSPVEYRKLMKNEYYKDNPLFKECTDKDIIFHSSLPGFSLLDEKIDASNLKRDDTIEFYPVKMPDEKYSFLHESVIIEYEGMLFAAWYNCERVELSGRTPIRFSISKDGGKNWSETQTAIDDPDGIFLYCPPVFGISDGNLYMLVNKMVAADYMRSIEILKFNKEIMNFEFVRSLPIPFKLNTNVVALPNGKLMLTGRVGKPDGFPTTPAALISDSGKIDSEWRLVKITKDGKLPDGSEQIYPEISPILCNGKLYIFSRNDIYKVPLMYISDDFGESFSGPFAFDIPIYPSKIYSGNLSDGRAYIIGNVYLGRKKLVLFLSEKNTINFNKAIVIQDGDNPNFENGMMWHYPCAWESDGKLYITYTVTLKDGKGRGAMISIVNL
ncbi:MAG: AraC family transcriptional regulator [Clostridia bacterium]|nr:AraC family transcriptional regulator [Clostridia bacterium]